MLPVHVLSANAEQAAHTERAEQRAPAADVTPTAASAAHPKPRGRAPKVDGAACTWDARKGCWLDAAGKEPDLKALRAAAVGAAARKHQAAAQQRRLEAVAWADDYIVRLMKERGKPLYTADDAVVATGSKGMNPDLHAKVASISGHDSFLTQLHELAGELEHVITEPPKKKRCRCHRCYGQSCHHCRRSTHEAYHLRVRRGAAYWRVIDAFIGTFEKKGPLFDLFGLCPFQGQVYHGSFKFHLGRHLQSHCRRWISCGTTAGASASPLCTRRRRRRRRRRRLRRVG